MAPEARQQGLGRVLMEAAEVRFRSAGARVVHLEVAVNNVAALSFYERLGFRLMGRIAAYYPDGGDAFVMEKSL